MPSTPADHLSTSVENYLKAVFSLTRTGRPATTTDLAHRLDVSAPSVSGMLRRLAEQGLVDRMPYRGVVLTDAGRRAALQVIRRHRLLETYLVQRLGLGWDEVHVEAERLEHAVSDRVLEAMARALGNPQFDPHGDPIPTADGNVPTRALQPLTAVPDGAEAVVRQVMIDDGEGLRFLERVGLVPGAAVVVREQQRVGGVVRVASPAGEHAVGRDLADRLLCTTDCTTEAVRG